MINVKSINAASYLSCVTGEIAKIVLSEKGLNEFSFSENGQNKKHLNEYRNALLNDKELKVDLIQFMKHIREYKKMSREFSKTSS